MVRVAVPEDRATVPSGEPLSVKVTEPVGEVPVTVAVKVTDCPNVEGLALEVSAVVEATTPTAWDSESDEVALTASPEYVASMGWLPTTSELVVRVATPAASGTVPSGEPSSVKVTEPMGEMPVTVAVKVTDCPNVDGLALEVRSVVEETSATSWVSESDEVSLPPSPE